MKRVALITGITSQDASFLTEQLLEKDYTVYGIIRRSSVDNTWRIKHLLKDIELFMGDMTDPGSLDGAILKTKPDEIYNLAAQSFVRASWDCPQYTFDVNAGGTVRLLEAVRLLGKKGTRVYQASSSEQYGKVRQSPQNECTPFYPRSIYGVSKVAAHWAAVNYRESYNMFISCGIAFNHESHRRGQEFLSRKVSLGVAKIRLGLADSIELGNLTAERDWGYAPEYTDAMWRILQLPNPTDMVLATGVKHSILDFVVEAFGCVGLKAGDYIVQNPKYMRPAEVDFLLGDANKARQLIDWNPKVGFKELVKTMVSSDIERLQRGDTFQT